MNIEYILNNISFHIQIVKLNIIFRLNKSSRCDLNPLTKNITSYLFKFPIICIKAIKINILYNIKSSLIELNLKKSNLRNPLKIAIIGTGYVGLVTGACFAETGNDVICVDIDEVKITKLKKGLVPFYEPGLDALVQRNIAQGRLAFTTATVAAVEQSQVIFMAVPTPTGEDGSADLQHLLSAVYEIAKGINGYKVIVNKSTVPVGTAIKVRNLIAELTNQPFDVVSNPEFLKEGAAVDDFMKPDRVVVGSDSQQASDILKDLYAPFMRTHDRLIVMRVESAEMTKYFANAFLATKVVFINEAARLCEKVGADINEVRAGISSDERIGRHFLFPSLGFGGSCLPKDVRAIVQTAKTFDSRLFIAEAVLESNELQKKFIPTKILHRFGNNLAGLRFALWGLAFKANTDDVRESPALVIIDALLAAGAELAVYDPQALENVRRLYQSKLIYAASAGAALDNADALIIATEWNEFRHPDFQMLKERLKHPIIFDGRNLFNAQNMRALGFEYCGIGLK